MAAELDIAPPLDVRVSESGSDRAMERTRGRARLRRPTLLPFRRALGRLIRTSTFRLAVLYMALFGASVLMLLGFIYASTAGVIDRQVSATIEAEISGLREQYRQRGLPGLVNVITQRSAALPGSLTDGPSALYLLVGPDGGYVAGNISRWPAEDNPSVRRDDDWLMFPVQVVIDSDGRERRVREHQVRALTFFMTGGYRLLVGRDMRERFAFQELIENTLAWALAITLLLGLFGGLLMSRNLLRRIDVINRTSRRIMEGHLSHRIPVSDARDEFDRLASNLNGMLDRIERLMAGMREVTDNVAHDLRSPLTRLKSRLEVTLLSERDPDRLRVTLAETVGDADRMLATFNALLSIARLESGAQEIHREPVDLSALVQDTAELYAPLIEDEGMPLITRIAPGAWIDGDRHLITQVVANLLDNAIKYAAPSARVAPVGVRLLVEPAGHGMGPRLVVEDDGPGIPASDRARVLERYVRLESSRTTPGNGLGLALVAAVARLHDAHLVLEATHADGRGVRLSLQFPPPQLPRPKVGAPASLRAVAGRDVVPVR